MSRVLLLALLWTLTAVPCLPGLPIKVISVDHRSGRITVLLPVHRTRLEATLLPDEPEIRLRSDEFYDAEIESGKIETTRRNLLRVDVPGERPVRFRLRKITFLE